LAEKLDIKNKLREILKQIEGLDGNEFEPAVI
jgi:hypothetical protein